PVEKIFVIPGEAREARRGKGTQTLQGLRCFWVPFPSRPPAARPGMTTLFRKNWEGPMRSVILFRLALMAGVFLAALASPAQSQTVTLYEGARVITGDGAAIENGAFIVDGNLIRQVGRKGEVALPQGASRVDLTGKTVMPTIVDMHG